MADQRRSRDLSLRSEERRAVGGARQPTACRGQHGKRLVIGYSGRCRRGSPRCFAECACDATLTAGETALVQIETDMRATEALAASVARLDHQCPDDLQEGVTTIAFAPGHKVQGVAVLLFAGDFHLDDTGTYHLVRPHTRQILDALNISYMAIAPSS